MSSSTARQYKKRVFDATKSSRGLEATQGVLPSGGALDVSAKMSGRVVDTSISHLDRHRIHLVRRSKDSSKMFIPLDPNEQAKAKSKTNRGANLHTDPFDESRARITFKKIKTKLQTPRGPEKPPRRMIKQCPAPGQNAKPGFITANGICHVSHKQVTPKHFTTTYQLEQPPKSYDGSQRFYFSPDKGRVHSTTKTVSLTQGDSTHPAEVLSMDLAAVNDHPTVSYRSISNVFYDPAVHTITDDTHPRAGTRKFAAINAAPTMEGVFTPMRNGKVPRPQPVQAPWAREQAPSAPCGVKMIAARQPACVPFAIEC